MNWTLLDYEYDPNRGEGHYVYERVVNKVEETFEVVRAQPCAPSHSGWATRHVYVHPRVDLPA
jgi:hypothetical protein